MESEARNERILKIRLSADGAHLFNRATGDNILLDEVKIDEPRWSQAPRQVSIALTNICDLACSHCYAPKSRAKLNYPLLLGWLKSLDENGCLGVGFGGGEPTLYPDFHELCKFTSTQTGLALTMTTHGHYLREKMFGTISKYFNFLRISMDGVGETYEKIRGRPFKSLMNNIAILKDTLPFGINFVVNSLTVKDLNRAIQIAEDLGAREFLLLPEVSVGRGRGIDAASLATMQQWIKNYKGVVRLAISHTHTEGIPVCEPNVLEKGTRAYVHIDADGFLKRNSFEKNGIFIEGENIMAAIEKLNLDKRCVA